ncbi:MAG: Paf1/RNA polymerase II complex, RTF1 component [Amphiamblys sp. WSBS2006]|nr:MAG: Paf1/RNA polymerase II complex, RTF1 component [Amphiamblys sp. WSBS2006]
MNFLEEMFGSDSEALEELERLVGVGQNEGALLSDGYAEDLLGDRRDREEMAALTEIQREQILYERAQKRKERGEAKRLRERLERKEEPKKEPKEEPKKEPRDEMSFSTFQRVFVSRRRALQCLFYPGFDAAVKGCFVRVAGNGKYRAAEIVEVAGSEIYKADGVGCAKKLRVRYGDAVSTCRLDVLSNTYPDREEYERNMQTARHSKTKPKLEATVQRKASLWEEFVSQEKTPEFIEKVIQNKKSVLGSVRIGSVAQKATFEMEREKALEENNTALAEAIEEKIKKLETPHKEPVKQEPEPQYTVWNYEKELLLENPCRRKKSRSALLFDSKEEVREREEPAQKTTSSISEFVKRQK